MSQPSEKKEKPAPFYTLPPRETWPYRFGRDLHDVDTFLALAEQRRMLSCPGGSDARIRGLRLHCLLVIDGPLAPLPPELQKREDAREREMRHRGYSGIAPVPRDHVAAPCSRHADGGSWWGYRIERIFAILDASFWNCRFVSAPQNGVANDIPALASRAYVGGRAEDLERKGEDQAILANAVDVLFVRERFRADSFQALILPPKRKPWGVRREPESDAALRERLQR